MERLKVGEMVLVRARITEVIEREDGLYYDLKCWKEDGAESFNGMIVKARAIHEIYEG